MAARRLILLTALLVAVGAVLSTLMAVTSAALPRTADEPPADPTIVLFHGEGCPHCAAERAFLAELVSRHPGIVVEEHEVWYDPAGRALLERTADELEFEAVGVPVTVVGTKVWIGFDDATAQEIEAAVTSDPATVDGPVTAPAASRVDVPILGEVSVEDTGLLAATLAIGFVDGINPCSLWVLSLLLAIVVGRGSRGRVLLVGGTFLTVTAAMYGLYMVGMYSAASYLGGMGWLRVAVALVAGVFGLLQLKDGLGVVGGPSLSISADRRPALYARMRAVASPERALTATLAGTVVLAAAVSLLETPCTAGLPLLWTTMLADQGVGPLRAALLFAVYMAVFLLDELLVFAAAVITLRATRVQERHGRALKLVAGSVLLALAVTMLVAPTALTTLVGTLVVFGAALALAAVLYRLSSGRASGRPSTGASGSSSTTSRTTA